MAEDFKAGREIVRDLAQAHEAPDVLRLSDEEETRVTLEPGGDRGPAEARARRLPVAAPAPGRLPDDLRLGGRDGRRSRRRRSLSADAAAARRGRPAGGLGGPLLEPQPLRRPLSAGRADGPRSDGGDARDRPHLEPAGRALPCRERRPARAPWASARSSCATSPTPTPTAPRSTSPSSPGPGAGEELEQWRAAKSAACEAIVATEGTITHHHAVGRDHAPYMRAEVGELGLDALRAVKERLDPAGIMNPGKLLPV